MAFVAASTTDLAKAGAPTTFAAAAAAARSPGLQVMLAAHAA